MHEKITSVNWHVLGVSLTIPIFFSILVQISAILEKINPLYAVLINLETFITFLLIFFAGITVSILLKAGIKKGIFNGALVGLIGELLIIAITTIFVLLTNPYFQIGQLISSDFSTYLAFNLMFMVITGAFGGIIGSLINKI